MASFPTAVSAPGGMSYAAPLLDFQEFGNLPNKFYEGVSNEQRRRLNDQAQQLNQQRIVQAQRQAEIAQTFQGGLPRDKAGNIDYRAAVDMLARKGDINALWNGADAMLLQQAGNLSPLLAGGGGQPQGAGGAPSPQPGAAGPRPQMSAPANSPKGDSGQGTVTSLVTDRLPAQNQTTGQTIMKIAEVMGVDPNANLTPGQQRRAQGLLNKYAPEIAGPGAGGAGGSGTVAGAGSRLPPSASAVTPSPQAGGAPAAAPLSAVPAPAPAQAAPNGAPSQAPAQPQLPPQAAAPAGGGPITPQVPLPKGFTDPQQAILALRAEAARLSANPRAHGQAAELNNWAQRIEASLQPLSVGPQSSIVDPRTGKVLYEGPAAAALRATEAAGISPSLDADAERYRQTGQLPPNMGRGLQGNAEAKAIRQRATDLEVASGGDPSKWPARWQDFKAQGIGKSQAERVRANREENLDIILRATAAAIPAALEASRALPRSDFVPLNKLIQNGQVNSSKPELVEFGMANLQLAEHWARAMNPTGVMRESDREKALAFLSTAYGNNTYERAVRQLEKQIQREKAAVREGKSTVPTGAEPVPGSESGSSKPDKDGWVTITLPGGKSARVQEVKE